MIRGFLFSAALLLHHFSIQAQDAVGSSPYSGGTKVIVYTSSGAALYENPDPKAKVKQSIPMGTVLTILDDSENPVPLTADKIAGHWAKVTYPKGWGYVFDGYLSRLPLNSERMLIEEYLASNFKPVETVTNVPDISVQQYERTRYENGIVYEFRQFKNSSTTTITADKGVISIKEMLLLLKFSNPEYFTRNKSCSYTANYISCTTADSSSSVTIETKKDKTILIEDVMD